ncbi:hypothetical protein FOCC_FOCC005774, partial [Frankliniella occidentalis]
MTTSKAIVVLFAVCALGALPTHARVLEVQAIVAADSTHPYCLTCDALPGQRYQLIRGADEVKQCTDRQYCDCEEHTQKECKGWFAPGLAFHPDRQACGYGFSCVNWLSTHPAPTVSPTTTST